MNLMKGIVPMDICKRLFDKIGIFVGSLIIASTCLILVEILLRSIFLKTLFITDEYCGYLMAIISFWGLCYGEIYNDHIKINFIDKIKNHKIRFFLVKLRFVSGLIFSGFLTYVLFLLFHESYHYHSVSLQVSETPLAIPQFLLLLGGVLLTVVYGIKLIKEEI